MFHFELVPYCRSIDSNFYSQPFEPMDDALKLKYPALVNRRRVILQQDNATAHTSHLTKNKIQEVKIGVRDFLP